jgi:endonuclease YncB( thermonuclease family)
MRAKSLYALLASLAFAHASSAQDDPVIVGEVVYVVDGDTADVVLVSNKEKIRIRLHGVDTPETDQVYGAEAEKLLDELIGGREVELQVVDQDRDKRIVARVYVDGVDVNAELIKLGAAYAERRYLRQVDDGETYCHHEHAARVSRLGIWKLPPDQRVAPWQWRDDARPFTDYTNETAEACIAAVNETRSRARQSRQAPTLPDGTPDLPCGSKRTCPEMITCDEAVRFLKQCGVRSLDRDRDGVPCEDLCR